MKMDASYKPMKESTNMNCQSMRKALRWRGLLAGTALAMLTLVMAACHGKGKQHQALTTEEREAVTTEVHTAATDIYDEVCRWYNKNRNSYAEHEFDDRFLTSAFRQDRNAAGGIGAELDEVPPTMDYDHWIQAQDWDSIAATIDSVCVLARDTARVFFTIRNCGGLRSAAFMMVRTKNGNSNDAHCWRIDDFLTTDIEGHLYAISERQTLQAYIAEYTPADNDTTLHAEIRTRVMAMYGEMIAACQAAKKKGETQSLCVFNNDRFLTRDYMRWYAHIDSIDEHRDGGDTFFFNTEHWGLNLDQDGIKSVEVLRITTSDDPSRTPALQADVTLRLTCETYYLQEETVITHSIVRLRMTRERGRWYVDDFLSTYAPVTEKEVMKQYVHQEWLQGVWDYEPSTRDTPAGSTTEVASHYIIHFDTLIYPKRCDPVQQDTYTYGLTSDTLFLTNIADGTPMKIIYAFSHGKLLTTEIYGEDGAAGKGEEAQFINVKRK